MTSAKIGDTAVYFAPVQKQYFSKWEYYQVDLDMLNTCFSNVIVCHSNWSFIKTIIFSRINAVYGWWWHQAVICVILARIFRIPVYITGAVHMYDESGSPDFFSKGKLFRLACRISWRLASRNFFISKSQYRQICSHEVVKNPCVLRSSLRAGYDNDRIDASVSVQVQDPVIQMLTVVWMTKDQLRRKSVYETLDALRLLVESGVTHFKWTIAGGSSTGTEELSKKIYELGLEAYVDLKLDLSSENKLALYSSSDLYIQPSYYEGFGNAVLEAMSFGLPAVVSRNTAQAEVIGDSGFIVEEIDAASIARVLLSYLNLSNEDRKFMRLKVRQTILERHLFRYRATKFSNICSADMIKKT